MPGKYSTLVLQSKNIKTGLVSATYASIDATCPKSCPFMGEGCYAQIGMVGIHTVRFNRKYNRARNPITPETVAREEAGLIKKATEEGKNLLPLRLHVAGDLRTNKAAQLIRTAVKNWNNPVWSYTHAWRNVDRKSWGDTISVLASCETQEQAELAMKRGYAVAMVTGPHLSPKAYTAPNGIKIIPCPAQTHDNVTCVSCKLCWNDKKLLDQRAVIGFEVHGVMKRRMLTVLNNLNDQG
jgi:hypothetical protein